MGARVGAVNAQAAGPKKKPPPVLGHRGWEGYPASEEGPRGLGSSRCGHGGDHTASGVGVQGVALRQRTKGGAFGDALSQFREMEHATGSTALKVSREPRGPRERVRVAQAGSGGNHGTARGAGARVAGVDEGVHEDGLALAKISETVGVGGGHGGNGGVGSGHAHV